LESCLLRLLDERERQGLLAELVPLMESSGYDPEDVRALTDG